MMRSVLWFYINAATTMFFIYVWRFEDLFSIEDPFVLLFCWGMWWMCEMNYKRNGNLDEIEHNLQAILTWCEAYPVDIFTPPTNEEVKAAVKAISENTTTSSDAIHGAWARHIVGGMKGYAEQALAALQTERKINENPHND